MSNPSCRLCRSCYCDRIILQCSTLKKLQLTRYVETTLLTPYSHGIIIIVENPSFSYAISIIWRRSRLVSKENTLHVRHHAFSRPFHAKIFVPRCQKRYFNQTFDRSYYPNGMIACGLCFIWQPNFIKNYSACCSRHSVYVFFNRLISRIENKFKPPRSDRGFLFEGFFQKFLHFHLYLSSHSDLFFQQLIYLF